MSQLDRAETTALLREALGLLERAEAHLNATPPDYGGALEAQLASSACSLRAFLTWFGSAERGAEADLHTLVGRAGTLCNVFNTSGHRIRLLAQRASAVRQALEQGDRLALKDREAISAGWYAARNLYQIARADIPAALHPDPL